MTIRGLVGKESLKCKVKLKHKTSEAVILFWSQAIFEKVKLYFVFVCVYDYLL